MFVTTPDFELRLPPGLGSEDLQFWRAVTLGMAAPWYLVTYRQAESAFSVSQTTLVAWETGLKALIEQVKPGALESAYLFSQAPRTHDWEMRRIAEVWLPADDEANPTGPLLFKLLGDAELVDSHLHAAGMPDPRRTLLAQMPAAPGMAPT